MRQADKNAMQLLRQSGALRDMFDNIELANFKAWTVQTDAREREQIWARQAALTDLKRQFNKAADGAEQDEREHSTASG